MNDEDRRKLLRIAREAVEAEVLGKPRPPRPREPIGAEGFSGAFVTLRTHGRLRGCIGTFAPRGTLPETVQEMAVAATHDSRFLHMPLTAQELPELEIEISVLSPLVRTEDPLSLELGKHGIYIRRGAASGCFLPQVATETGWSKEEFLSRCCEGKAGLPADAWRDPATEVYLFTAEVFSEADYRSGGRDRPATQA